MPGRPTSAWAVPKASWRWPRRWSIWRCAPKSNAVYVAWPRRAQDVERFGSLEVPLRFRNAPTRLMKELGYGSGYRYAHDEPEAYAAGERYLPDEHAGSALLSSRAPRPGDSASVRRSARLRAQPDADERMNDMIDPEAAALRPTTWRAIWRAAAIVLDVAALQALEEQRKHWQIETDRLRAARNANAKAVGQAQGPRRGYRAAGRAGRGADRRSWRRPRAPLDACRPSWSAGSWSCRTCCTSPCRTGATRAPTSRCAAGASRAQFDSSRAITWRSAKRSAARFRGGGRISGARFVVMRGAAGAAASRAGAVHARPAHARARLHRDLCALPGARAGAGRHRPAAEVRAGPVRGARRAAASI